MTRLCSKCKINESRSNHTWCKNCLLTSTKKWQKEYKLRTTKEERAKQNKRYMLKAKYQLTLEEYELMLKNQNYSCKICSTLVPGGQANVFAVDHCHETGKIRGLLCSPCNLALGMFKDSENILLEAIKYLKGL